MTPTLRAHFGGEVRLHVELDRLDGELYRRRIVLTTSDAENVIESGVVRIHLQYVPQAARATILDRKTPLGDVLARHGVLTRVEPMWYLRFPRGVDVVQCFRTDADLFGRLAMIHCNGEDAVELLEVVAV